MSNRLFLGFLIVSSLFMLGSIGNPKDSETKVVSSALVQLMNTPEYQEKIVKQKVNTDFIQYRKRMAKIESGHNWKVVNQYGYMGLYQFGIPALRACGVHNITLAKFVKNPNCFPVKKQHKVFKTYTGLNYFYLKQLIEYWRGKTVRGVVLTDAGILAGAHLVGSGSAAQFLTSGGVINPVDGNGVSFLDYAAKFSDIKANFDILF